MRAAQAGLVRSSFLGLRIGTHRQFPLIWALDALRNNPSEI